VATLSAFTGRSIANFIRANFNEPNIKLFTSGGGARNPFVVNYIKQALPNVSLADTSELGINPDAKEAILFALLGNEALCGEPIAIGNNPEVLMGKFSFPL
jgi:anhydro-N-acetylmuramic acid kinase